MVARRHTARLLRRRAGTVAGMGYKLLGFVVWRGGLWYARRRYPRLTDRRVVAAGLVGTAIAVLAVRGAASGRPS